MSGGGALAVRAAGVRAAAAVGLPAALLAAWWLFSAGSTDPFFPPLSRIVEAGREVWTGPRLAETVLPSLGRLLTGFAIAGLAGVAAGVVVGLHRRLGHVVAPLLEFVRAIPPPVLVPVLMLFLGIGDGMRIAVIVLGCVWPVLLNTVDGVRSADPVQVDTARSLRLGPVARLRHLVLPAAAPRIAAGLHQALGIGIVLMVVSEMFAAQDGLGMSIVQFQQSFAMAPMWSGVLLLGVIGVVLSLLFRLAERRALRWYLATREGRPHAADR